MPALVRLLGLLAVLTWASAAMAQTGTQFPTQKFHFEVTGLFSRPGRFQEITGLDHASDPTEYRSGDSNRFSTLKMPGIKKLSDVTMKKGVVHGDNSFWAELNDFKMNANHRRDMTVSLLDENEVVTMRWTLHKAFPTKVSGTDLKSAGDEVAIDTIVVACEKVTVN